MALWFWVGRLNADCVEDADFFLGLCDWGVIQGIGMIGRKGFGSAGLAGIVGVPSASSGQALRLRSG
jgi:hypothetical protein